jgi:MoaA/NifB/PqqE/SkfB family radical SAM enzyme
VRYVNIVKSRLYTHTPLVLTHNVTYLCNCKCKTCDLWKKTSQFRDDLPKEAIFRMLDDARDAGMVAYVVWGGEPLMRKDLPEILAHARGNGLYTTVITNGFLLPARCEEIAPHTDLLIVSMDSDDELHDEMRVLPGIRMKALEGVRRCKELKINVMINSVISTLNLGKADGLIRMAAELDVPIAFEPLNVYPGYNEHLKPADDAMAAEFARIIAYKKTGRAIVNSTQYLETIRQDYSRQKSYVCHAPEVFVEVHPDGTVARCTGGAWCNVKDVSLKELFNGSEYRSFCQDAHKCTRCVVSCVIESSLAYSLNPGFLYEKARYLL